MPILNRANGGGGGGGGGGAGEDKYDILIIWSASGCRFQNVNPANTCD